jgi:hypothetical protein
LGGKYRGVVFALPVFVFHGSNASMGGQWGMSLAEDVHEAIRRIGQ